MAWEITFTYNDEGIRTSKTVNGVTTTYYLSGSQIIGEETEGNISGAQIVGAGAIVIGTTIMLFDRPDSGRIRYQDDTGRNPSTGKSFDDRDEAIEFYRS